MNTMYSDISTDDVPTSGPIFSPGTRLAGDRFEIIERLGKGGMGAVYKAHDLTLRKKAALKFRLIKQEETPREAARNRRLFLQEAAKAQKVTHPNVCRIFDFQEIDGYEIISMEFIGGEDVAKLLRRIGRLPPARAVELGLEICEGLEAIHSQGLFHQDLKPANVMVDHHGHAKITDLGLAGRRFQGGTPQYAAPEQFTDREVSVQSDLYSFGLVFYEMLTNHRAFTHNCLEGTPPPPSDFVSGIDAEVEAILLRCLRRDPRERPASASAVARILGESMIRMASAKVAISSRRTPWIQRVQRIGAAVVVAAFCIVILITVTGQELVRVSQKEVVHQVAEAGGDVWFATDSGAYRIIDETPTQILKGFQVNRVAEVEGEIWLGSVSGLFRVEQETLDLLPFEEMQNFNIKVIRNFDKSTLVGTTQGLYRFEANTFNPTTIREPVNVVKEIYGKIWVGTNRNVYQETTSGSFRALFSEAVDVGQIVEAGSSIWVVVRTQFGRGKAVYRLDDGDPTIFYPIEDELLPEHEVISVGDAAGNVWFATTQGLMRLTEGSAKLGFVDVFDGPVNMIASLENGQIWMATTRGAFRRIDEAFRLVHSVPFSINVKGVTFAGGDVWVWTTSGAYRLDKGWRLFAKDVLPYILPFVVTVILILFLPNWLSRSVGRFGGAANGMASLFQC